MANVYLAAAYGRREEIAGIGERFAAAGHTVTARWLTGQHATPPDGIAVDSRAHDEWCAVDDLRDVLDADVLVSFAGGGNRNRGGRHVEFGIGLATRKRLILVGDPEHVFHALAQVEQVATVDDALALLAE